MFEIEQEIAAWRRQMIAGGIKSSQVIDELESHLRDDIESQIRAGTEAMHAFETAVRRLGNAAALECEFEKVGETIGVVNRAKHVVLTFAGIPHPYASESMNTSSHLEPRWATYSKAVAFLAPAICFWGLSIVFLVPKLEQIHAHAGGVALPSVIQTMKYLTDHALVIAGAIVLLLILLEWRVTLWPRYRRATIGAGTFVINGFVLISIFMMVVAAVLVAPALMQQTR